MEGVPRVLLFDPSTGVLYVLFPNYPDKKNVLLSESDSNWGCTMGKLAEALRERSKRDDAIIVGSEIRAALNEQELDDMAMRNVVLALHQLVALKELKEMQGKCPKYLWMQQDAWSDARTALAEFSW